ncbi:MAG: hypothetical protein QY326_04670 [Bdellovibrionota bacterium]|nr:MAG: hypothetical protein QY326_04670 [Bdellovibrionota bacterium]
MMHRCMDSRQLRAAQGYSLLEMLLALTLWGVTIAAVTQLLVAALRVNAATRHLFTEVEHETTWSLEKLARSSCTLASIGSESARICASSETEGAMVIIGDTSGSGAP